VGLVEGDDAVEVSPKPVGELLQPGLTRAAAPIHPLVRGLALLPAAERTVGGEEDAPLARDGRAGLGVPLEEQQVRIAADPGEVPSGVLDQPAVEGDPDGLVAALGKVVEDDPGDLAALADPGAIADEEALSRPVGQALAVGLPGIDHGLELGQGEPSFVDCLDGQMGTVGRHRGLDGAHGRALDQPAGVRVSARDAQALGPIGGEDGLGQLGLFGRFGIGPDLDRNRGSDRYRGGVADWARSDATISSRSWAAA
jgi:hypothetical protein